MCSTVSQQDQSIAPAGASPGLSVRVISSLSSLAELTPAGPVLTHLDGPGAWPLFASMTRGKGHEVVVTAPLPPEAPRAEPGCAVELVADDGEARLLLF